MKKLMFLAAALAMSMEIPLYYYDGEYGYTAKFTLDINSVK